MTTMAELGFIIKTDPIRNANTELDKLGKTSSETEKKTGKFASAYSSSMAAAKKSTLALSAAFIGVSAAIVKYTNDGLANIDSQAKLARAMDATADGLRAVQIAAGDAGLEGMDSSLNRLNRRLGAAAMGNKEYSKTIEAMGLDLQTLSDMDVDDRIAAISDAVKNSGLSHQETARHLQMLGFEQANANAFFRQGGDAVRNAKAEVDAYGLSLSAIDSAKVEAANDAWSRVGLFMESVTNQLAISMAPVIQTVAGFLTDAAKEGQGFGGAVQSGVDMGVEAFAYLADVVHGIETAFDVAGKSIAAGFLWLVGDIKQSIASAVFSVVSGINSMIDIANSFGANFSKIEMPKFATNLAVEAKTAKDASVLAIKDIHKALMEEPPSNGIIKAYEAAKKSSQESAVQAVAAEEKKQKEIKKIAIEKAKETAKETAAITNKESKETSKTTGQIWKEGFEKQTSRIADSLQDAITSGNWAGIGATVGGALAGGITASVTEQMTASMGAIGAGFAGAVAGGIAGLAVAKITQYFSDGYVDPTAERQATQGTGTVLGSMNEKTKSIEKATGITATATDTLVGINRGMLQALENINRGILGASGIIARGSADVGFSAPGVNENLFDTNASLGMVGDFNNALGSIFTGGLYNSLGADIGKMLGGSSKKKDEGVQIVGGYLSDLIDDTMVNAYATFKVKKNAWSKSKNKTKYQQLGDEVGNQFGLVFDDVLSSVLEGAEVFGIGADAAKGFKVDTKIISTEGMSAAQQTQAYQEYFGTVFDNLAGHTIPWLEEFQQAGEGLGETLARVATETQVTQEVVSQLGIRFADLSGQELVEASSRLVEFTGGIENLASSMSSFTQNFASEAQQFDILQGSLNRAFNQTALSLPATREGYYNLLKAQNGSTAAGAENIATLLRLQGTAHNYYSSLEQQAEEQASAAAKRAQEQARLADEVAKERAKRLADIEAERQAAFKATIDLAKEATQEQITYAQTAKQSASEALKQSQTVAQAISNALGGIDSRTGAQSRTSALDSISRMTSTGQVSSIDELNRTLSAATNINMSEFADFNQYIREVSRTGQALAGLQNVADKQVTEDQRLLANIENKISSMSEELVTLSEANTKQTAKTARILERIEIDGLEVRA